jgi:hypothetical protein
VRRPDPLGPWHLPSYLAGRAAVRWCQQVTQLPEQHQRDFHRQHERDQPSERRSDMTRKPTRATRETRGIQA